MKKIHKIVEGRQIYPHYKLDPIKARKVRKLVKSGRIRVAMKRYDISMSHCYNVLVRRFWK